MYNYTSHNNSQNDQNKNQEIKIKNDNNNKTVNNNTCDNDEHRTVLYKAELYDVECCIELTDVSELSEVYVLYSTS